MSFLDKLFGEGEGNKGGGSSPFESSDESENFFDVKPLKDKKSIEELIKYCDFNILKTKIDSTNFREVDEHFHKPLYYATVNKRIEVIKYLLELGSDFEDAKEFGSVISTLIQTKDVQVLKTFVEAGYRIIPGKYSVMAQAAGIVPLDFIEYLIELDVPMESCEEKGFKEGEIVKYTPVEMAIMANREYEIIEALIRAGCPLNEERNTPLVCRIIFSSIEPSTKVKTLHLLADLNKLDLNAVDEEGTSLVKQAINYGDTRSLKELIKLGADFSLYHHQIKKMLTAKDLEDIVSFIQGQGKDINEFLSLLTKSYIEKYISEYEDLNDKDIIYQIVINTRLKQDEKLELLQLAFDKNADIDFTSEDDKNSLYFACKNLNIMEKNLCVPKFLLENGASVEYGENSALFYAISDYNIPLIKLLLSHNANVNFVDKNQEGVINYFYKEGINLNIVVKKREVLKLLIDSNLDINTKVKYEKDGVEILSFFTIFCIENEFRLIEYILENKLEVSDDEVIYYAIKYLKKDTLLKEIIKINPYYERKDFYEIANKKSNANIIDLAIDNSLLSEFIEYIMDTYPDIKTYNEVEPTLLDTVSSSLYSVEFIEKLVKKDSNINRYYTFKNNEEDFQGDFFNEGTILSVLLYKSGDIDKNHKYYKVIRILLENGADLNLAYKFGGNSEIYAQGHSAFIQARNYNRLNKDVYDLLYEFGGSLTKPVKECFNESSIHSIVRYLEKDEVIVEYLEYCWEKEPFDLDYRNSMDSNIFLNAAMSCHAKTLRWLANKGSNIHVVGGFDNSPALHKAIANYSFVDTLKRLEAVKELLDLGVDIEQFDSDQMSPLIVASRVGTALVVKELLQRGAKVNNVNENNESALHHAILGKNSYDLNFRYETVKSKIITELVNAGAHINLVAHGGATALIYAIDFGYREIFDTLINLGADINQACSEGYLPLYYAILKRDRYFVNKLYSLGNLEVNKVNEFNFTVLHQLVNLNLDNDIFKQLLTKLIEFDFDINYHKDIEPPLLMYVKMMEFVGDRQVGFVSSKKKPKEIEHKKVKIFMENGANIDLCLEVAKKQNEAKDIIEYLKELVTS